MTARAAHWPAAALATLTALQLGCTDGLLGPRQGQRDDFYVSAWGAVLPVGADIALSANWDRGRAAYFTGVQGADQEWPADAPVTWTSSDTAVARVTLDGTSGRVTARAPGTARITVQAGNRSASVPVRVLAPGDYPDVSYDHLSAGGDASCGVTAGSIVRCWGLHTHGALGLGGPRREAVALAPVPVVLPGGAPAQAVSAGANHACAVDRDGRASCWGYNGFGEVGDGSTTLHTAPTPVATTVRFRAVDAGGMVTCGLDLDGRAHCWGAWPAGRYLRPTLVPESPPFVRIAAGEEHACALTAGGEVHCWGANDVGQLGTVGPSTAAPRRVPLAGRAVDVTTGQGHSCALTEDGRAVCWGSNTAGALGIGSDVAAAPPTEVAGLEPLAMIAAGGTHGCALARSGRAYCWGDNGFGQLGDGLVLDASTFRSARSDRPQAVVGGPAGGFRAITAGGDRTCAIGRDGEGWCWGAGNAGSGRIQLLPSLPFAAHSTPVRLASPGAWP